jgi:LacI family transcriptional regulator
MEMKIKIPQELAFITFDDSFWLTMTTPSLSAVAQDPDNIGEIAGKMIYERLMAARNNVQRPNQMVRVQTQLIIRGSC